MNMWIIQNGPRRISAALLALALLALSGCSHAPPQGVAVVTPFELERYLGTWYEIARLDHSFERGLSNVHAVYSQRPDGSVEVINRGYDDARGAWQEAVGTARFIGPEDVGSLKVSFFGPFYGGYHIVALDRQDYRWAMVMGPDRDYLWILARDKHLPDDVRVQLMRQAAALGVDVSQLIWVGHGRDDA